MLPQGALNAQRYRDDILDTIVRPYAAAIGPDFVLQADNARRHTAQIARRYLEEQTIVPMKWPARSPDLNPIEHVWDAPGRRVAGLHLPPQNLQALRTALCAQWDLLPMELVNNFINSMQHRCRSCIAVSEDHTPYRGNFPISSAHLYF